VKNIGETFENSPKRLMNERLNLVAHFIARKVAR
jgi:hypothetical protein